LCAWPSWWMLSACSRSGCITTGAPRMRCRAVAAQVACERPISSLAKPVFHLIGFQGLRNPEVPRRRRLFSCAVVAGGGNVHRGRPHRASFSSASATLTLWLSVMTRCGPPWCPPMWRAPPGPPPRAEWCGGGASSVSSINTFSRGVESTLRSAAAAGGGIVVGGITTAAVSEAEVGSSLGTLSAAASSLAGGVGGTPGSLWRPVHPKVGVVALEGSCFGSHHSFSFSRI
jgi:hypothetical protein